MENLLFVYGTLKKHRGNDHLLAKAEFIAHAFTDSDMSIYGSSIPFLVWEDNDIGVTGEIYRVTDEELAYTDRLEGHPSWYKREKIVVIGHDGTAYNVWAYIMPEVPANTTKIISGEY